MGLMGVLTGFPDRGILMGSVRELPTDFRPKDLTSVQTCGTINKSVREMLGFPDKTSPTYVH